ncbi:MAG: glutamate 5-kinase [Planctomycetes bacterium]|nr:glutamate 5-kinase [Planctomycetota bacterium]
MSQPQPLRPPVAQARRVVLKVGTRVLTHDTGRVALARLFAVVEAAAALRHEGREALIVSSGAVGLGRDALGLGETPVDLAERQACAAVGQTRLMGLYHEGFARLGLVCGQVLLTQSDFDDRLRYLNLRTTLETLLRRGVVPVINENDAVATEELALLEGEGRPVFGDNDKLSALVATKLGAELLVLLTDVEGVYDRDPRGDPGARLLARVDDADEALALAGGPGSAVSRGGMRSKVEAAAIAQRGGCHAVIASGRRQHAIDEAVRGAGTGTWFPAGEGLPARQRWIAFAAAPRGTLHLDPGAVEAVRGRGASLLPRGVVRIEGEFRRGDVVVLRGPGGDVVGRGMAHVDAAAARRWLEGERPEGLRSRHALVHRDHLVLED